MGRDATNALPTPFLPLCVRVHWHPNMSCRAVLEWARDAVKLCACYRQPCSSDILKQKDAVRRAESNHPLLRSERPAYKEDALKSYGPNR